VADAMDRLLDCAFEPNRNDEFAFDFQAVRKMKRVGMIDPMPMLCRDDLCPAVIGNAVVYRDSYHLSATFARTLANWLERKLPDLPKPALRKMTAKQGQTVHT
jgi:hypothetical protein